MKISSKDINDTITVFQRDQETQIALHCSEMETDIGLYKDRYDENKEVKAS